MTALKRKCCLFYSAGDYGVWKSLFRDMEPEPYEIAVVKLNEMYSYCAGVTCRHRAILRYFGQDLDKESCAACDICLGELDCMEDSLVTSQKILSCILRLGERFGGAYTASVLVGSRDKRVMENGHNTLSTYGLLSDYSRRSVHDWIEQLAGQECVEKTGEYNVLRVTAKGWRVLRSETTPRLLKPSRRPAKVSKVAKDSWEGVDRVLFEALRSLRATIARQKKIPAYIVFDDRTLREMARCKPCTWEGLLDIKGVGRKKRDRYGRVFLATIKDYCADDGRGRLPQDIELADET